MNINCIICSDLFNATSAIYVTQCGHIFHYTCLIQWIERSKTCPQCRNKTSDRTIFRVFFNIVTLEGIEDDAVTLQSKLDAANLQLRLKEGHVKATEDNIKTVTEEKAVLEDKCKNLKHECDKMKSGISSMKEQMIYYKDKAKYVERMEKEVSQLKESFRSQEQALKAITGSVEEATDIIHSTANPQTLATIATTLKKEMLLVEKKKNNYFITMKQAKNELHACQKELDAVTVERNKLKLALNEHKECQEEMQTLKQKIKEMMDETSSVDAALKRVAMESPAPSIAKKIRPGSSSSLPHSDSPSVADRVNEIKNSKSPYLRIKSSTLGLRVVAPNSGARFGSNEISIFNRALASSPVDDSRELSRPLPEYSYDGFGGHSKDEKFPEPRRTTGIKRSKSSMSSSKFKKLAKPNRKIDDFLDISIN